MKVGENMKLIVGLGNPGLEYEETRHNMGFKVIDKILISQNVSLNKTGLKGVYGKFSYKGEDVILLKPLTYMNLSGECVRQVMDYFKISIEDLLVIYDDMDTDIGSIRLRLNGNDGGHNGIKNIIQHLGTNAFKRIRIGIGKDQFIPVINYVLGKPRKEDKELIENAIEHAKDAALAFTNTPFDKVMSMFNGAKK